jgi:hypothetical protein
VKQILSRALLASCFIPVPCLAYSSTLKMEATYYSETSVDSQRITQHYLLNDICAELGPDKNDTFSVLEDFVSEMPVQTCQKR